MFTLTPDARHLTPDTLSHLLNLTHSHTFSQRTAKTDLNKSAAPPDLVVSSALSDFHDEAREARQVDAVDIADGAAYSIEEMKQRTEEDNRLAAAELKKDGVRLQVRV